MNELCEGGEIGSFVGTQCIIMEEEIGFFWFAWHRHLLACLQKDVGGQIFAGHLDQDTKMIVKIFASCLLAVAAASSESSSSESGSREGFRLWFECISVLKQGNILKHQQTLQKYQLDLNL